MRWSTVFLKEMISGIKVEVSFDGAGEEGIEKALEGEAVRRLGWVEQIACCDEMTDAEKLEYIRDNILKLN